MLKRILPAVLLMASLTAVSFGQADNGGGGPGGPGGGPGGGGGPPDFAQMRQRMEDRMKQQLDVTDDQWDTLQPKIEKVQELKRELRLGGGGGGPGGPGGPGGRGPGGGQGGPGGGQGADNQGGPGGGGPGGPGGGPGGPPPGMGIDPNSPVQLAITDLREAIRSNASDDTIKTKVAALRKAISDVKAELATAQKDLASATNLHQQAVLLTMNVLD